MANEIHNTLKNNQQPLKLETDSVGGASQPPAQRSQEVSQRPRYGDWVTLTDTATRLRDLSQHLADEPFLDTRRVERIQQQLAEGSYRIDATQIADKLLAQEQFLGGGTWR
jgi:negative regulator of flagellin synthesis FlgM